MGDLICFWFGWVSLGHRYLGAERNGALHCMVWVVALGFFLHHWVLGLGLGLGIWHHGKLASMASGHGQDHHSGSRCFDGHFYGSRDGPDTHTIPRVSGSRDCTM